MSKLVRESIGFERGGDPRKTLNVGRIARLKDKYGPDNLDGMLKSASLMGDLEDVKFLVKQGADIEDDNPLKWAAGKGHLDVVKFLVEQGANIHAGFAHSLRFAAGNGHLDVVKYLVEHGENIKKPYSSTTLKISHDLETNNKEVKDYLKSKIKDEEVG